MNILVLDDTEAQHPLYRHILKYIPGVGKISMSSNQEEFEKCLKLCKPHVILCDIHMEPKSGPDILRENKVNIAGVEVIILSCADAIAEESNALALDGINIRAYFQKPIVPDDLYELLSCR